MQTRRSWSAPLVVALLVAVPAALPACADAPAVERAASPILGGQPATDGQFPSVVALQVGGGLCTGTLVSPEWVLTAAHCIDPAELGAGSQAEVTRGLRIVIGSASAFGGGRTVQAKASVKAPEFSQPGDPDVGLIRLATPVTDVTPTPINFAAAAAPVGLTVRMVGYGVADNGGAGKQYFLEGKTSTSCAGSGVSDARFLCFDQQDGRGQCNGDSGGPSLAMIDGVEKVVGITSFGDQDCQRFGADMRTDAAHAFIAREAPELDCQADGACNQACGAGALPADPDCPTCATDPECGSDELVCDDGRCVPAPLSPGGLGAECGDGQPACVAGQCGTSGDERLCTTSCDPASDPCPDGFDCVGADSGKVCWPADGGCQAGGGAGWSLALGVLAALGLGRRRRAAQQSPVDVIRA